MLGMLGVNLIHICSPTRARYSWYKKVMIKRLRRKRGYCVWIIIYFVHYKQI